MKICKANGCDKNFYCKGYCVKHYMQHKRYGETLNRTIHDCNKIIVKKDHALIELYNAKHTTNAYAMIDLEDVEKCKKHKWGLNGDNGYVRNKQIGYLHNFILNRDTSNRKITCDHDDRNPLNNQKRNLIIGSHSDNNINKGIKKNNTSGYTGISFYKPTQKWCVEIRKNNNRAKLGYFTDITDAICARIKAELKYFGKLTPCYQRIVRFEKV